MSLEADVDWNNLNKYSIQELKSLCAQKNLRPEGKPVKARYVEVLENYRDAVNGTTPSTPASETPKKRRGRPKSGATTPAQSPAIHKQEPLVMPKLTADETIPPISITPTTQSPKTRTTKTPRASASKPTTPKHAQPTIPVIPEVPRQASPLVTERIPSPLHRPDQAKKAEKSVFSIFLLLFIFFVLVLVAALTGVF